MPAVARPPKVAMRKRLAILTGVVLAAAVIVPAALEVHAYRQKIARGRLIDQEHCDRIEVGMRQAEVEAILGGPPGDFTTEYVVYLDPVCPYGFVDESWESWSGNEGQILVSFDKRGAVRWRQFEGAIRFPPPSLAERLRGWLQRLSP
jgi:hypothetical protein